jgi:hypothetical protein
LSQVLVAASHESAVHVFESSQSPSERQQPATAAFVHEPVETSHVSVVQAFPSMQSASLPQQPGIGVVTHVFVVVSHAFAVHALVSAHSASVVQQALIGLALHVPPGPLQVSAEHTSPSSQSPSTLQHPGTGVARHVPGSSQASAVHALRSSQETGALIVHRPLAQTSAPLQAKASPQLVPSGALTSIGQEPVDPSQTSAASHAPALARQGVPAGA